MPGDNELLNSFFTRNRNCIINADLDGLLSGMFLQKYLNWKVVGFSMCNGAPQDNLWLNINGVELDASIFIDLHTASVSSSCIDQHMVAIDEEHATKLSDTTIKINPNIMRGSSLFKNNSTDSYQSKYPFGTVHFIIACLENLNLINDTWQAPNKNAQDEFDATDLILRADRVSGNFVAYNLNCRDWAKWLLQIANKENSITSCLFSDLLDNPSIRAARQTYVEQKLKHLQCERGDGACAHLLSESARPILENLLNWLATFSHMPKLEIPNTLTSFNKLRGHRIDVSGFPNSSALKNHIENIPSLFSYAITARKTVSVTIIN